MAEKQKNTQTPETHTALPTVESILVNVDIDANDVDLTGLVREITDVIDRGALDALNSWGSVRQQDAEKQLDDLQEMLKSSPGMAKTLEQSIKLQTTLVNRLKEVVAAVSRKEAELKLREPFSPEELFKAFETAQATQDMTAWNLAVTKMGLQIKEQILAELGAGGAPRTEANPASGPVTGANPEATATATVTPEVEGATPTYDQAVAKIKKFREDHPQSKVPAGFDQMNFFAEKLGVKLFVRGRVIAMAAEVDTEIQRLEKKEKYAEVDGVLEAMTMEDIVHILREAPKYKDGRVLYKDLANENIGYYNDLAAQLLFMNETFSSVMVPSWIKDEDKPKLRLRTAGLRELAQSKFQLLKEYYSDAEVMESIKRGLPNIFIGSVTDQAPSAPATPSRPADVVPSTPGATAGSTATAEATTATAAPAAAAPETNKPDEAFSIKELATGFGVSESQLADFKVSILKGIYSKGDLVALVAAGEYSTSNNPTIYAALDKANSADDDAKEAQQLLTTLLKKSKKP